MVSYPLHGGEEDTRVNPRASSDADNGCQPDHPLEGPSPLPEESFLVVEHDRAHGVFRSPRPSVTLSEMLQRELRYDLTQSGDVPGDDAVWLDGDLKFTPGDGLNGGDAQDSMVVRGGASGNNPWDELWMAQELDFGAESSVFDPSTAEAQNAWEEAAVMKHDDEEWHDLEDPDVEMPFTNTMRRFEEVRWWGDGEDSICSESEESSQEFNEDE